jgi:hypothetical protein
MWSMADITRDTHPPAGPDYWPGSSFAEPEPIIQLAPVIQLRRRRTDGPAPVDAAPATGNLGVDPAGDHEPDPRTDNAG